MVTLHSPLSTGLTSATRQLDARGAVMRLRRKSCRVPSTQGGWVWGGGVPLSTGNGSGEGAVSAPSPENFWSFEWKMARFGAFWVLFMQSLADCSNLKLYGLLHCTLTMCSAVIRRRGLLNVAGPGQTSPIPLSTGLHQTICY